jgi:quercetin dioxygenase-like cupin family protein
LRRSNTIGRSTCGGERDGDERGMNVAAGSDDSAAAAGAIPANRLRIRKFFRDRVTNAIGRSSLSTSGGRGRSEGDGGKTMFRKMLVLAAATALGTAGATAAWQHEKHGSVKQLAARDLVEKVNGKEAKATAVEVTLEPGQKGSPHRHPGPVLGYVLEGEYEWAIDEQPAKTLKAGETFYEPGGCLHRVSKNPAASGKTRVLAWVLHPRDAAKIVIPEPTK